GQFPSLEFPHDFGLGVLCVGREVPADFLALCSLGQETTEALQTAYAELGRRLTLEWENQRLAAERDTLRAQMQSLRSSLCWRLTAPLRLLHRLAGGR
ncbi:MAG: hypothetical protein N2322_05115, partial [Terrimicrobiaceae bacterium]|nr:hypothetical protein [Terrimicrobiaceae bacterium]